MDIYGILFRLAAYMMFGVCMEVLVSSITTIGRAGCNAETKKMIGSVSIFMCIVYGPGLLFLFEPLRAALAGVNSWIQFLIYGAAFTIFEFIAGLFFDKVCRIKLWDYSTCDDSIMGYTRTALFFQWGFCGLLLSSYAGIIIYLSQYITSYFN